MQTEIKTRLEKAAKALNISIREFERRIGASNGYVAHIRRNIDADKMSAIKKAFPQLNPMWLQYGEGEMFDNSTIQSGNANNQNVATNINNTGTFTQGAVESEEKTLYKEVISLLKEQIQALKDEKDAFLTRVGCPSLADVEKKMDELKNQK